MSAKSSISERQKSLTNNVCHRVLSYPKRFFQRLVTRKPIGLVIRECVTSTPFKPTVTLTQMIGIGIGGIIGEFYRNYHMIFK